MLSQQFVEQCLLHRVEPEIDLKETTPFVASSHVSIVICFDCFDHMERSNAEASRETDRNTTVSVTLDAVVSMFV